MQKRMFKAISPVDRGNNKDKFWVRLGTARINKDDSINIYLDALPITNKNGECVIQLREMTDEDFRRRSPNQGSQGGQDTSEAAPAMMPPPLHFGTNDASAGADVPF